MRAIYLSPPRHVEAEQKIFDIDRIVLHIALRPVHLTDGLQQGWLPALNTLVQDDLDPTIGFPGLARPGTGFGAVPAVRLQPQLVGIDAGFHEKTVYRDHTVQRQTPGEIDSGILIIHIVRSELVHPPGRMSGQPQRIGALLQRGYQRSKQCPPALRQLRGRTPKKNRGIQRDTLQIVIVLEL